MTEGIAAPAFDVAEAVRLGHFVQAAYTMYAQAPNDPKPAPVALPDGYRFVAWIQMKDFILESGDWAFYGLLAQSTTAADEYVLAIRGTQNLAEWWDDLTAVVPVPWVGPGAVGFGFNRIYQTLRVVETTPAQVAAAVAPPAPPAGSFARQVAAAVQRHTASLTAAPAPTAQRITVTGHSLGSALATLYVADNGRPGAHVGEGAILTPLVCTFASPRVGNDVFAEAFAALPVTSWRIANELDIVTKLPSIGFQHVDVLHGVNSGALTPWTLSCWHSLKTYLHMLDPREPLDQACMPAARSAMVAPVHASLTGGMAPAAAMVAAAPARDIAVTVPPGGSETITITIKVGP